MRLTDRAARRGPRLLALAHTGLPSGLVARVNDAWTYPARTAAACPPAAYEAAVEGAGSVNLSDHANPWSSSSLSLWDTERIAAVIVVVAGTVPDQRRSTDTLFEAAWRIFAHIHAQGVITGTCTRTQAAAVVWAACDGFVRHDQQHAAAAAAAAQDLAVTA